MISNFLRGVLSLCIVAPIFVLGAVIIYICFTGEDIAEIVIISLALFGLIALYTSLAISIIEGLEF